MLPTNMHRTGRACTAFRYMLLNIRASKPLMLRVQAVSQVDTFMQWLRCTLFELLLMCAHHQEQSEQVWQAAAGAFVQVTSEGGAVCLMHLAGLSNEAVRALLDAARRHTWCALLLSCS